MGGSGDRQDSKEENGNAGKRSMTRENKRVSMLIPLAHHNARLITLLTAFTLIPLVVGCQEKEAHVEPDKPAREETQAAVSLPLIQVKKEAVRRVVEVPGHVSALPDHSVMVTSYITGKIERMLVVPGQRVTKGQLIAVLDDRQLQDQLRQALTPIQSAKAAITQAEAEHEFAKRELQRLRELFTNDLAAKKDVLAQETLVETSKARLDGARARLVEVREASGDEETLLKLTKISSPIPGVVAERFLNIGDEARPNAPIVHIVDLSEVVVDADMPADLPNKVALRQKASVKSVAEPDELYTATIISISPTVDTRKNTIKVRLQCVNRNQGLREGQAVTVALNTGVVTTSISVPRSAIVPDPENPRAALVYVVRDGKAKRVPVVTGVETSKEIEITGGLSEGDTIIASGAYGLPEGVEVKPAGN